MVPAPQLMPFSAASHLPCVSVYSDRDQKQAGRKETAQAGLMVRGQETAREPETTWGRTRGARAGLGGAGALPTCNVMGGRREVAAGEAGAPCSLSLAEDGGVFSGRAFPLCPVVEVGWLPPEAGCSPA